MYRAVIPASPELNHVVDRSLRPAPSVLDRGDTFLADARTFSSSMVRFLSASSSLSRSSILTALALWLLAEPQAQPSHFDWQGILNGIVYTFSATQSSLSQPVGDRSHLINRVSRLTICGGVAAESARPANVRWRTPWAREGSFSWSRDSTAQTGKRMIYTTGRQLLNESQLTYPIYFPL